VRDHADEAAGDQTADEREGCCCRHHLLNRGRGDTA
jgi:hypothetical protein